MQAVCTHSQHPNTCAAMMQSHRSTVSQSVIVVLSHCEHGLGD